MSKFIFILFLFCCSMQVFSQKTESGSKVDGIDFTKKAIFPEKQESVVLISTEIVLFEDDVPFSGNLCQLLAIKVSDFLNESMLHKLLANV